MPCLSSQVWIFDRTDGRESSENCDSSPGLLVRKIDRFHSQMHVAAEGTPDVIDAPAPRKRECGVALLIPIDRMSASRVRSLGIVTNCLIQINLFVYIWAQLFGFGCVETGLHPAPNWQDALVDPFLRREVPLPRDEAQCGSEKSGHSCCPVRA